MKKKCEMEWKQLISMFWCHEIVLSQISKPVAETTAAGTQQTHPTVYTSLHAAPISLKQKKLEFILSAILS